MYFLRGVMRYTRHTHTTQGYQRLKYKKSGSWRGTLILQLSGTWWMGTNVSQKNTASIFTTAQNVRAVLSPETLLPALQTIARLLHLWLCELCGDVTQV
jgi:hypothetical protein